MPENGNEVVLDRVILDLLQSSSKELTPDEVEVGLVDRTGHKVDTFAVRRAIWRLVLRGEAIVTPQRSVKAS